jgi:WD40-like Beta Propeller Repeat
VARCFAGWPVGRLRAAGGRRSAARVERYLDCQDRRVHSKAAHDFGRCRAASVYCRRKRSDLRQKNQRSAISLCRFRRRRAIHQVNDKPAAAPSLSPDGKWLLVAVTENQRPHIELWPTSGSGQKKVFPFWGLKRWSRDSRGFAYIKLEGKASNIWLQPIDGGPQRQLTFLPPGEIVAFGFDFSRDGKQLIFAHRSQIRDVVLLKNVR